MGWRRFLQLAGGAEYVEGGISSYLFPRYKQFSKTSGTGCVRVLELPCRNQRSRRSDILDTDTPSGPKRVPVQI